MKEGESWGGEGEGKERERRGGEAGVAYGDRGRRKKEVRFGKAMSKEF